MRSREKLTTVYWDIRLLSKKKGVADEDQEKKLYMGKFIVGRYLMLFAGRKNGCLGRWRRGGVTGRGHR